MMNDLEKKCYCFVLQCYFGDMADPVNAAIDRAYGTCNQCSIRADETWSR